MLRMVGFGRLIQTANWYSTIGWFVVSVSICHSQLCQGQRNRAIARSSRRSSIDLLDSAELLYHSSISRCAVKSQVNLIRSDSFRARKTRWEEQQHQRHCQVGAEP